MGLRLNKEGVQYVLGLSVKDDPVLFSQQVVLSPGELEWLPSEATIIGFSSLADAQRSKEELRDHLAESPSIYQVSVKRLEAEQAEKS